MESRPARERMMAAATAMPVAALKKFWVTSPRDWDSGLNVLSPP
jgi:hypothetical protein